MKPFMVPRALLSRALNGDARVVQAFEAQQQVLSEVQDVSGETQVSTKAMRDATFITTAPNDELPNERVLAFGIGLNGRIDGDRIVVGFSDGPVRSSGGFEVRFVVTGDAHIALPTTGILATIENAEALKNKTLERPKLTVRGDYADDAAAAAGGVAIGEVYRTGNTLKVRLA